MKITRSTFHGKSSIFSFFSRVLYRYVPGGTDRYFRRVHRYQEGRHSWEQLQTALQRCLKLLHSFVKGEFLGCYRPSILCRTILLLRHKTKQKRGAVQLFTVWLFSCVLVFLVCIYIFIFISIAVSFCFSTFYQSVSLSLCQLFSLRTLAHHIFFLWCQPGRICRKIAFFQK